MLSIRERQLFAPKLSGKRLIAASQISSAFFLSHFLASEMAWPDCSPSMKGIAIDSSPFNREVISKDTSVDEG